MLKIFQPNDKTFTTNGDAVIQATRAVVHKVDNGDFYIEIETGLEYLDYIKPGNIIVADLPNGAQAFRISTIDTSRKKIKCKCWHVYYDSNNYLIADSYVVNKNCNAALQHLDAAADVETPFSFFSDVLTVNSFRCVRKSLNEAITTVLTRWGGHLVRDNFNVQIKNIIGKDNGVVIQYRKNLKEINVNYNWQNVCTKVLPVGADGLLLDEKYVYSTLQYETPFSKVVSFEQSGIVKEDYATEAEYIAALKEDLQQQARAYVNAACVPAVNYTVNANVEKITDVGDLVTVFDERLNVDITAAVLSFDYDCILQKFIKIEFGSLGYSLNNLLGNMQTAINTAVKENNTDLTIMLQAALIEAEGRIWERLNDSYCIFNGDQIIIVDTLPAETANNCIKINNAGISFSSTGINGNFKNVWNINGTFNAADINLINFTADVIKGGILKTGSNNNLFGAINVFDSANNLIAEINQNGLTGYAANGTRILINADGFSGYDHLNNKIFGVSGDQFIIKKSAVETEINLFNKLRFVPVTIESGGTVTNTGAGLFSILE